MGTRTKAPRATGSQQHRTREKILAASLKLVASKGYAGTSISMICREAGLNASSLYWFFKNKEDLFLSAIRDAADEFLRAAEKPLTRVVAEPEDTLEDTIRVLAEQLQGNANFLRLLLIMMLEERDLPPEVRARIAEIRARSLAWWKNLLLRQFARLGDTTAQILAAEFAPLCRATVNGAFIAQQYGEPIDLDATLRQLFLLLSRLQDRIAAEAAGRRRRAAPKR
ncbi:MAG: TetR/AcrR family transcriptional regulator [Gammaproteobacteria bacterium]